MSPLTLAYGNILAPALGPHGFAPERLAGDLSERFRDAHAAVTGAREAGELGFFDLPGDVETRRTVQEVADSFGQWFETLVVVGIGGSSLGARALADALLGLHWNLGSDEDREHYPRLFFLENADPESLRDLMDRVDPRRTLFNIVSKSGSTAETMAQFMVIEGLLSEVLDDEAVAGHLIFTTDPETGVLRRLANERGIPALAVPRAVGGRFSVLSSVGLLPAAVTGVDLAALLEGAAAMVRRCEEPELVRNPAGLFATLLHAAHTEQDRSIHVLMPYADRLRVLALWFQQLWAESLGKAVDREGRRVETGPTPMAALGAVDQHSLLQLLMEGPRDKVVVFLRNRAPEHRVEIPRLHSEIGALSYLGGHELGELLEVERRATAEALRREGRPSLTLELDRLDARGLGEFFMLMQIATVYAGALYGVNPLDQPGVELGKELTYGLLGREGYPVPELQDEDLGGYRI
ncbi:MAG: glucose-6-phosphate isomerase [Gemmatimonadales bacterium]|nr:MAG: glucose-6-phosphate isomerase [Gemmatimonadales bacterium]